ncbi:ATP-binding protein [Duganella sp. CF517]|uniref:ATP-binding protein n=1 Tax=Duganella sp. CF517 TaxID=1881038 RepID=UPI001E560345|nr:ATP-binding protein [Duganella sp. CF517]
MSWLSGGGEMGQLIRSMDWSATALGPLSRWPQSLRTSVSLCLSSTFPILVAWGPDDIQIYNDAYRPICGAKHPEAMGAPFKVCWATALPVVGDAFDRAHAGEGVYIRDQRMFLDRYGYLEEAFMTFSFSPIRVESGNVGGIFHPITESTGQVLNARRTQNLRDLTGRIARSRTIDELAGLMDSDGETLALDLPFMLLYELVDGGAGDGAQAPRPALRLRGRTGLPADSALAPAEMAADAVDGWAAGAALALADGVHVDGLAARFGRFDCAPYPEAPTGAMLLPLFVAGSDRPYGMLVAGVSARRALDDDYRNFYELLRAAFNTAIGNVLAYELEQRRAAALAEIDKAKTAFFSNVSHEFRTPLTLILGPLEDALADAGEPLAPRQRERIDVTHRNALRLLKLVNSLLDFSRIEAGRVQARYAPVDLAQLTANLASVFTAAMDKAGLAYHVDTPALAAPVYVDLDMWEKIVFNLLSNAFKFTLSGAVTVTLAAAADGRGARLTVRDTGSGIPAAELPKVFERFHRVEGVQGRSYEGTGIGLALIQVLVRLHGGSIGVDSAIGVGTAFHVEIPFGAAHLPPQYVVALPDRGDGARMGAAFVEEALRWLPDEPADAGGGGDAATATAPAAARARILVADDNQDMRGYVRLLLEREYLVETCADGEAAMEAIVRDPPDLLLSDVMMPRLDGFGLMRRIRAHPALAGLPIILLSARAGQEAKIEGLEAGADDYLVKPFSANELLARIRNHIELARERRQATIALRQREEYFRSLVNASPAMIWTTDAQGRRDFLSQRWSDYTGRSLQQDLGRGWLELIHADDAARVDEAYCAAFGKAAPFSVDYRLKDRHGAFRWMIDAGAPRFDQDGKLLGHIGTLVDVHERRLLQDRFANVTRASGIGVWYADAPLTLMQPNAQLRQQFGLPAEGPVTMAQFYLRVHHEDRARVEGDFHSAMVEGVAYDDEFRVALAAAPAAGAASARWIRMIAWCQRAEGGARDGADGVTHFDGVTLDVSDQKSGEHELRALTAELSQANQAQREFLVTLAHELRNPLAPIRSGLEMMRAHDLARDEFERVRAMMDRQVGHLVHLVDDLLDLARIARGKEVLVHSLVELEQVVRAAVEISMPLIDAGGHRLLVSAPSNAPPVWLDAHRVAQVIGNLLNNAAKYTPNGGTIELMAVVEAGELTVTVRDNGIGIPADALPTVFDMFTQVPGSEGQAQGGLGIGLNLVRRLVELHGGEVSAHSGGAGQGSAFTLRLPVTPSVAAEALARSAPAPALPAAAAPRVDEASASSLRVLVVDDNVDAAETLTALLEFKGHTVAAAHDGPAALAAALSLSPQVVFLDIGLPGMSGYEVARALRAMPALDGVALIALTGWGTDADRLKTDAAGFDHHLTKPVSFDEILRMLTALERQQKA